MKFLKFGIIISIFFIGTSPLYAEIRGEIININSKYQIFFTDLNNSILNIGDIVIIQKNGKSLGYLQVSETSSAISKLIPANDNKKYPAPVNLQEITVGSIVLKEEDLVIDPDLLTEAPIVAVLNLEADSKSLPDLVPEVQIIESQLKNDNQTKDQLGILSKNYADLSNNYSSLISKKNDLENKHLGLQEQFSNLESRLKNLEQENNALKQQIQSASNQDNKNQLDQCNANNQQLKNVITSLKPKLLRINQLLSERKNPLNEK